ncbi:lysophospholipid acyltransferase family protein [Solwaraspora sp. WMMD791]|uniref:lysophospholipid acyltransferase family protein n=1 Tax=Solwaraspora sp. WMMD791 TaxID=3016086 RepID=UPI00249A5718|nr:lysophospholipid acyltransferase family protein [Solwaraspora sp. WMMD791]WFE28843.1 lysophospholipid acyltransferase family protein [Solwaraspora sp. WMMD791]
MNLIDRACVAATTAVTRRTVVHRHLAAVEGIEHVPMDRPFILAPNHRSFADHFLFETLLFAIQGNRAAFLTKAESFTPVKRIWFNAMGAVPVDRARPVRELLATVDDLLDSGRVVVVYPEGTRNPDAQLMAFKDGAFRFAERAGVPVVPAALVGTERILPIGASWPRGHRARVHFGPALHADMALPRAARIRDLAERTRVAIDGLLTDATTAAAARVGNTDPDTAHRHVVAAGRTAQHAEALLERSLSGTDTTPAAVRHRQAELLYTVALRTDPGSLDAAVGLLRVAGLRALTAPAAHRAVLLRRVRVGCENALARDPDHLTANYLLGRWHLLIPKALGGRRERAVHHLGLAHRLAHGDNRYAMAYAEALIAAGRPDAAVTTLRGVIADPVTDQRGDRRRDRAIALLASITGAPAERRPVMDPQPT